MTDSGHVTSEDLIHLTENRSPLGFGLVFQNKSLVLALAVTTTEEQF